MAEPNWEARAQTVDLARAAIEEIDWAAVTRAAGFDWAAATSVLLVEWMCRRRRGGRLSACHKP
jgi:hypothetical protein